MAKKQKAKNNKPVKQATKSTPPTQRYLPFREIRDGVVIMKDGSLRRVMLVSSLNFALKSQEEQEGIIQGYIAFLNSLEYELQIVIQSRPLNINRYLEKIDELKNAQTNELLRRQTASYRAFVEAMVKDAHIMDKKFFVVVPFSSSTKKRKSFWSRFMEVVYAASSVTLSQSRFAESVTELDRRVQQVNGGLQSIGLQSQVLDTQALIELYYNTYNPVSTVNQQRISDIEKMQIDWETM